MSHVFYEENSGADFLSDEGANGAVVGDIETTLRCA